MRYVAIVGDIIDGKYEILTLVGQGGMSKVYLARDNKLNRQLAVKEVQKNARDRNNEIVIQSAIAEANILKNLSHVGLAYIVDIIDTNDQIYIIMEYVEGESLDTVLDSYGAQPQELVIEWAKQLCVVLEYLHTRSTPIIYRDMKPANIRLKPDGNLKLIDFGIAREYKEQNLADTVSLGTKGYAAPEQFGGKGQTDARTDIYCLGATLYHLVTGQNPAEPPYEILPIRHWNPALSGGLERIIQKCTQLNPNDRYLTCADLLYALEHYEEIDDLYRAKQKKKLRWFILVAAMAVLSVVVGITGLTMRTVTNNQNYSMNVKSAQDLRDYTYCLNAINIDSSRTSAYEALIEIFEDDNVYTKEETDIWSSAYASRNNLESADEYQDLAFKMGRLIMAYSDYGSDTSADNEITRWSNAASWFEKVQQNNASYSAAQVYLNINKALKGSRKTSGDTEVDYREHYDSLKTAMNMSEQNTNDAHTVRFQVYRRTILSIEEYSQGFKSAGLTQNEVQDLFDQAQRGLLENVDVSKLGNTLRDAKEEVESRLSAAQRAIELAFRNNG